MMAEMIKKLTFASFLPWVMTCGKVPFNLLDSIRGWPYDGPHFINEREVRPLIRTAQVVGCRVRI